MRGGRLKRWLLAGVSGLVLALLLTDRYGPTGLELVIRRLDGGPPLVAVPLAPGERFTLHYVHSVDRAPIWEEHSADPEGNIYIEEERFVMFGAGMGDWPRRGHLTARGPYQVIENIHRPVGEFVLRVGGDGVNHALLWRGTRWDLSHAAAGQAVLVSARPVGLLQSLWRRLVPRAAPPTMVACRGAE